MHSKLKKLIITVGYTAFKIVRAPIKLYWKIFKIQTYGVRIMLVYKNELILVRHWYNSLWVMPGGGIQKHETPEHAAIREVQEELGIIIKQLDFKLGTYSNIKEGKTDTVHCFVVEVEQKYVIQKRFNLEVSDIAWSDFDHLPEGTSKATRTRIQEYLNKDISLDTRPWS
jgi:8-oxo-dGTP pyrophosphatase MutT (NUDIX family)